MSPCHEPSTVSISWGMLRTYGRILLGVRSWMRWRNSTRLVSVSLPSVRDTQNKCRTSQNLGNYQRLPLWVWAGTTQPTLHLHPDRWLPTSMPIQAFLRSYLPIFGKRESFCSPVSTFSRPASAMQTLITIRAWCVTKTVCACPAYVNTPASGSVMNPVEIASSRSLM